MSYRRSLLALARCCSERSSIPATSDWSAAPTASLRLFPGLVRIPDIAFVSWARIPGGRMPKEPIPDLVPDLAVEVLSPSNTPREMALKRRHYFEAGVRLVWIVDPEAPDRRRLHRPGPPDPARRLGHPRRRRRPPRLRPPAGRPLRRPRPPCAGVSGRRVPPVRLPTRVRGLSRRVARATSATASVSRPPGKTSFRSGYPVRRCADASCRTSVDQESPMHRISVAFCLGLLFACLTSRFGGQEIEEDELAAYRRAGLSGGDPAARQGRVRIGRGGLQEVPRHRGRRAARGAGPGGRRRQVWARATDPGGAGAERHDPPRLRHDRRDDEGRQGPHGRPPQADRRGTPAARRGGPARAAAARRDRPGAADRHVVDAGRAAEDAEARASSRT